MQRLGGCPGHTAGNATARLPTQCDLTPDARSAGVSLLGLWLQMGKGCPLSGRRHSWWQRLGEELDDLSVLS